MLQNLLLSVLLVFTSTSIYRQPNTRQNTPQRGVYGTYTPNPTNQSTYRGFGYGSQATYQAPVTFQVDGTYTYQPGLEYDVYNYGGGSAVHGGGPRRVKGYTSDGEEHDDGNSDTYDPWIGRTQHFWDNEDEYTYYWSNDHWYRTKDGVHYEVWTSWAGWHTPVGILYDNRPSSDALQGYRENPTPIGSPLTMVVPAVLYAIIEYRRRRRSKDEFA